MGLNRDVFFGEYRARFGKLKQAQVDGLTVLLDAIEDDAEFVRRPWRAYLLATVYHECAFTWQPIVERGPRAYFQRYEGRADLGNTRAGDGYRFRGRGYVQITGRANYVRFSRLLGLDLVEDPDQALAPAVAYRIASLGMREGLFTGRKLAHYLGGDFSDYRNARKIINGLDKAELIARYALRFEQMLKAAA